MVFSRGVMRYFYPRPPRGGRLLKTLTLVVFFRFLSTPSARRATVIHGLIFIRLTYFYPRPPRGGRPSWNTLSRWQGQISIHALREEGDDTLLTAVAAQTEFLSTPSARRATMQWFRSSGIAPISIHALREEGDCPSSSPTKRPTDFYPRPPRGGRRAASASALGVSQFLSTPSARRATDLYGFIADFGVISIHALREEGDCQLSNVPVALLLFLSTPSARRATTNDVDLSPIGVFLSTPSARRATI